MKFATLVQSAVIAATRLWVQRSSSIFNRPYLLCCRWQRCGKVSTHRRDMRRAIIDGNQQRLAPAAKQAEQIARANLAVGGFQHATQAGSVIPVIAVIAGG